jgi:hypothetical protein
MYKDLRDRNQAENKAVEIVSGNTFQLLGLKPALGRLLTPQDDTAKNANSVLVLSYDYWKTRFAASRDVVGQTVLINEPTHQIPQPTVKNGIFSFAPAF